MIHYELAQHMHCSGNYRVLWTFRNPKHFFEARFLFTFFGLMLRRFACEFTFSFLAFLRALFSWRSASLLSGSSSLSLSLSMLSLPLYLRLRDFFFFDLLQIEWVSNCAISGHANWCPKLSVNSFSSRVLVDASGRRGPQIGAWQQTLRSVCFGFF